MRQLREKGYFQSSLFDYMEGYVSQCQDFVMPAGLKLAAGAFQIGLSGTIEISNFLAGNSLLVATACDASPKSIIRGADEVRQSSCDLASAAYDVADLFDCAKWKALYTTIVYDSLCYEGTRGMSWMALMQFLVVFFSMVMLTLLYASDRAQALAEVEEEDGNCEAPQRAQLAAIHDEENVPRQASLSHREHNE